MMSSKLKSIIKLAAVFAAGLTLAGCQSKNPLDYLPQSSAGYMGMNMMSMQESAGLKRLNEEMKKMQQGGADLESEKAQKIYIAFDSPASAQQAPAFYGVAIGMVGFADEVVGKYKASGATEGKTSGRVTYTSGPVTISPVGETGLLFFQDTAMLDRMIAVSKKKQPNARASNEFNYVETQLGSHAMVLATKAQPIIELAGPMLTQLEAMNKTGVDALRQVTMLSLAFNWDTHPVLELLLHLPDKQKADALSGMINGYLTLAKGMPMLTANPSISQVVSPLQATASEEGVSMKVEIPAAVADQLFAQLDAMAQMGQQQQMMMQQGMQGQNQQGQFSGQNPGAMPYGTPGATPAATPSY